MKSSCSARGLSVSQNLPEIALILSVSLSFRLSLYSTRSTHPHPHSLLMSPYWSAFGCLFLPRLFPPCPLQILSLHQSVSSPTVCNQYESTRLICNHHFFCQWFSWCLLFTLSIVSFCQYKYHLLIIFVHLSVLHSILFPAISLALAHKSTFVSYLYSFCSIVSSVLCFNAYILISFTVFFGT